MEMPDADIREPALPISELFGSDEAYVRGENFVTEILLQARRQIPNGRVSPGADIARFQDELAGYDFTNPEPLESTIAWVVGQLEGGLVHVTHPRYFGLFNPAPSLPSELADRIVNAFNPQLATATTSPAAIAIERHLIRAFADRAGLPADAGGHFATGGSEANFSALICALVKANPAFVTDGISAFTGRPTFYASEDAHHAWLKIAMQCGLGQNAVRLVPTDGSGQLDPAILATMIQADSRAGLVPVMVVATAGTTCAGIIDPLLACADVAKDNGLWFHVDAAWGGALLVSDRLRGSLAGIERSDSITIDAHKWLATTMACSLFITRSPQVLKRAFFVDTQYMPPSGEATNPYTSSPQWSRRFLGLRLFLALATIGWQGYGAHVERSVVLASILVRELIDAGWVVLNRSHMAVVCAVPPEGFPSPHRIAQSVVASGRAWISTSRFQGQDVLRICLTNGRTTRRDVLALLEHLNEFRLLDKASDAFINSAARQVI